MSVLASWLDPAPATDRANRSANLRLLEELAEQFAQSRAASERYVPATGTRYRAVGLPLRGGEGYGRLRRVPDVRIKAVVTNRGNLTRRSRAGIPTVMGPEQLAGVMSILARQSAEAGGRPFDEAADQAMRQAVEGQIQAESTALFNTGLLYDDGILDPRATRTVLGIALSACHSGEVKGTGSFGVFRM
jgi:hypothetical protein